MITTAQLARAGLGRRGVSWRVQAGQLHRQHRGVYSVGQPNLSPEGRWMAAVLACGAGAVLSHLDAAAHLGLLRPWSGPVHVTVQGHAGRRKRDGIVVHRCPSLNPADVTRHKGIPVTKAKRAIADLRGTVPPKLVRRALRQAAVLGLASGEELERTRSDLELLFLDLCRRHGLPRPEVNVMLEGYEVDFFWPRYRLIVEIDSWLYHRGRQAFEDDHARDAHFAAAGYRLLPFTDAQLDAQPGLVLEGLRTAIDSSVNHRATIPPPRGTGGRRPRLKPNHSRRAS